MQKCAASNWNAILLGYALQIKMQMIVNMYGNTHNVHYFMLQLLSLISAYFDEKREPVTAFAAACAR